RTGGSTRRDRTVALTEEAAAFSEFSWHWPCSDGRVPLKLPVPLAFVMSSFEPGGTERQMIELARRLDPTRWTIHIACFRARGGWFDRAAAVARSVAEFPVRSFKSRDVARHMHAFACWARAQQIAVVHTTDLPANLFGLPAAAFARV